MNEESVKQDHEDTAPSSSCYDGAAAQHMIIEPVPNIPWFHAKRLNPSLKIEESKYFKDVMEQGDCERGRLNLVLYKIINECFPYYLPKIVHCMDFSEIAKQEDSIYKFGKVATHFVITNVAHSLLLQVNLEEAVATLESTNNLETFDRLLTYLKGLRGWLEPGFGVCEKPEELLLEPWVLIQLPLHPAVAHQWLVAAFTVYFAFRKQIAFLRFINLPQEMLPLVHRLYELGLSLLENLIRMLVTLDCWMKSKNPGHPHFFDGFIKLFCCTPFLSETVSIIEFLLSNKCRDMIKCLKKQAWNSSTWDQCRPFKFIPKVQNPNFDGNMNHLYNYKFWMSGNFKQIFGTVATDIQSAIDQKQHKSKKGKKKEEKPNPLLPFEEPKFNQKVDLVELGQFIEAHILAPGWLKGISKEEIVDLIEKCSFHFRCKLFASYHRFKWFKETSEGICAEDSGVQHNLMNLTSEAEAEEALADFIDTLILNVKIEKELFAERVYLEAVDCEGPHFSISEIETAVFAAWKSKKWSMESIFAAIQKQYPAPGSPPVDLSDPEIMEDEDVFNKVMSSFEVRVKHITMTMYKGQLGKVTGKEKRRLYLELQVVQYILPWVVISARELFSQQKKSNQKSRNLWHFVWFVHSLISQYEEEKCHYLTSESSMTFSHMLMSMDPKAFLHALETKCQLIPEYCKLIFDTSKASNQNVFDILTKPFSSFMQGLDILGQDKQWQDNFKIWCRHSYRFISKVCLALEKTAKHCQIPLFSFPDSIMYGKSSSAHSLLIMLVVQCSSKGISQPHAEAMCKSILFRLAELEAACYRLQISEEKFEQLKTIDGEKASNVFFYQTFSKSVSQIKQKMKEDLHLNKNPLDSLEEAFNAFMSEDLWKLKQILAKWRLNLGVKSPNLVSLEYAKRNKHNLYGAVLSSLGKNNKVKMQMPGTITFFPIKHCHWCGLVDWPEFRICQLCKETDEYLDKIMFCSERCESQAMEGVHGEEHCRFNIELLMLKRDFC